MIVSEELSDAALGHSDPLPHSVQDTQHGVCEARSGSLQTGAAVMAEGQT